MNDTAVYALTRQGTTLGRTLATTLGGDLHCLRRHAEPGDLPFDRLGPLLAQTFHQYRAHVFVVAAGIVIRTMAPLIGTKDTDPAVVCLDQHGRFAVSLLSGHLGGGNALAEHCARITGGQPVITTATDSAGLPSLDMLARDNQLHIGNLEQVKTVNGALLDGASVQVRDPGGYLPLGASGLFRLVDDEEWTMGAPGAWVSWQDDCPDLEALWLYPKALMLGIGCRRGIGFDEIFHHVRDVFDQTGLSLDAVGGVASIDLKADEQGILALAAHFDVQPVFYSRKELDAVVAPNPSERVKRNVGTGSVSEAAALLLSGNGELVVEKTKTNTVTLAVARRFAC